MLIPPKPPEANRAQAAPQHHQVQEGMPPDLQPGFDEAGQETDQSMQMQEAPKPSRVPKLLVAVLVLGAVLMLLRFQVFTIRNVNISGLQTLAPQQVAKAAGLDRGLFYFTLSEEAVRRGINSNRYLVFVSMHKVLPNSLHIKVIERRPYAFFTQLGVGYVMAQDGIILEQTKDLKQGKNLMLVNGLSLWTQQEVGRLPASTDQLQMEILIKVFEELALWQLNQEIEGIDIAQSLNISLQTKDGYTINLGSEKELHAKVGTVVSVLRELRRRQMSGGIIEAARPGEASYLAPPQ